MPGQPGYVEEVIDSFRRAIGSDSEVQMAVLAIKALTTIIQHSTETTIVGLQHELKSAARALKEAAPDSISLSSGCELFLRVVTRTSLDIPDFSSCKQHLVERGTWFADKSRVSRDTVAMLGDQFVRDGTTILTHGYSRTVMAVLLRAAANHKHFSVIVTEARPNAQGYKCARRLTEAGVPTQVILDCAVGYVMRKVDLVLTGAEGVVENGGIINKIGTNQIALIARAWNKPVYVASESYKFTRLYPLSQKDVPGTSPERLRQHFPAAPEPSAALGDDSSEPDGMTHSPSLAESPAAANAGSSAALANASLMSVESEASGRDGQGLEGLEVLNPRLDYTPPSSITLLVTDLGILTPSAVSDELIKLYA